MEKFVIVKNFNSNLLKSLQLDSYEKLINFFLENKEDYVCLDFPIDSIKCYHYLRDNSSLKELIKSQTKLPPNIQFNVSTGIGDFIIHLERGILIPYEV